MTQELLTKKELMDRLMLDNGVMSELIKAGLPSENGKYNLQEVVDWRNLQVKAQLDKAIVGNTYKKKEVGEIFLCSIQQGMARSHRTNTLVLFADHTGKSVYDDKWFDDVLHYTGMGLNGDQTMTSSNRVLNQSKTNFVNIHLFEAYSPGRYTYMGEVELAGESYQVDENDEKGNLRKVYKFPIRLKNSEILIDEETITENTANLEKKLKRLKFEDLEIRAKEVSRLNREESQKTEGKKAYRTVKTKQFSRDANIAKYVKELSKGICQLCDEKAPFEKDGEPYLHCHHIKYLAEGGLDVIENCVAVCPNCHARIHELELKADRDKLITAVAMREEGR